MWSAGHQSATHSTAFWRTRAGTSASGSLIEHRRHGYATEIFRQSIVIACAEGVERVLVTCDDDNVTSGRVIERCGGVFDPRSDSSDGGSPVRRYWID